MSTRAITVPVDESTFEALRRVARDEYRHPRDQAALILRRALARRIAETPQRPHPLHPDAAA